jgi:hypothetical protein
MGMPPLVYSYNFILLGEDINIIKEKSEDLFDTSASREDDDAFGKLVLVH